MSDMAMTVIICVFLLLSWPVWAPVLYMVALLIVGALAFAFGMTILGVVWFCELFSAKASKN